MPWLLTNRVICSYERYSRVISCYKRGAMEVIVVNVIFLLFKFIPSPFYLLYDTYILRTENTHEIVLRVMKLAY